ncbi:hypothetical protein TCAL_02956 [Tigriopus californicus]|uniref:Piwi domain-containing protein n=1 Tax=Tigriopus californicus TaxID=6832 RepID=A0A553NNY5_TIGCA|nr:protein argonaute-2-like [Tigriopus californicus]TRY67145.1 hypothetical protein TCAL_02956 [Tigriopus californicus]|eukprot:TCALIF_02956-PA protein Name:"Similar to Ago2 Protein argonaute-2 (Mus musculus)" AED:0.01 eAED:0.01 QI:271/1/1/1/1/1/2/67/947
MGGDRKRNNRNKGPPSTTDPAKGGPPPPSRPPRTPTVRPEPVAQQAMADLSLAETRPPTAPPSQAPIQIQMNPSTASGRDNTAWRVPHYTSLEEKRKHLGTLGKKVRVRVNHFEMRINLKHVHHYDVTITSEVWKGQEARKGDRDLCFRALDAFKKKYGQMFPKPFGVAYDGFKQAYSTHVLPFGPSKIFEGLVTVPRVADLPDTIELKIRLKQLEKVDISGVLQDYIRHGTTLDRPQDAINVVNIILSHLPQLTKMTVGRSILNEESPGRVAEIGGGKVLWTGVFPTFRPAWKFFLNVDMVNKPGYEQTDTLEFILKSLNGMRKYQKRNMRQPRDLEDFKDKYMKMDAESEIKNLKVRFHRPDKAKRDYKVNKFGPAANKPNVIDKDGKKMSIEFFFATEYKWKLNYPGLPTLHVGNPNGSIYLPMELTEIKKQVCPMAKKLSDVETASMIRHTAVAPDIRQKKINESLTKLSNHFSQDPYAKAFEVEVSKQMSVIPARILDPPGLLYKSASGDMTVKPALGKWDGKYNFLTSVSLTNWGVLNMNPRLTRQALSQFVEVLYSEGQKRGLNIDYPEYRNFASNDRFPTPEKMESEFKALVDTVEKAKGKKPELIMVIISARGTNEYSIIKHYGDMVLNIPTQFVLTKNVEQAKPTTLHNICLKINSKLGGTNLSLDKKAIPPWMNKPCMIMGGDVTHPSPDKMNDTPSIAAIVGSQDPKAAIYNLELSLQRRGQVVEVIEETERMVKSLLLKFFNSSGKRYKPFTIVYYRDGVSEGQFDDVLNKELSAIRRACTSLEADYKPHIVFIVAQKRHKTRMFPENPKDTLLRSKNVMPGTVVDQEITHPTEHNFFLASHEGIQGTTKPTSYHKLWDDLNMSSDSLQQLTFYLCHLYSRCERSVSYPAPTYYAHLAAERAKCYYNALIDKGQNADKEALRKLTETQLKNNFI